MKIINKLLLLTVCLFPSILYSQIILDEDFSSATGTTPPTNWINNEIEAGGGLWVFNNPGGQTLNPPFSNQAAIFDSDYIGFDDVFEETGLESPSFDVSNVSNFILLEFDHKYIGDMWISEYYVEVWDGTDWIEVLYGYQDMSNPEHVVLNITNELNGATDAKVRFVWVGYDIGYWIVDNVKITATDCLPVYNITADNSTQNSIDLSWDTDGTETEWNIEYGPVGFTPGTGIDIIDNDGNLGITINGLNAGTYYDFYVQANCATSTSMWTGPFKAFTTGTCSSFFVSLYDEYYDGWTGSVLNIYNNGVLVQSLTLTDGDYAQYEIPANIGDVLSTEFIPDVYATECSFSIEDEDGITLFESTSGINGPLNLGDFNVPTGLQACPTCPVPTDIELVNQSIDEIEITWTEGGTETEWNIEYGAPGFTLGSGINLNDTDGTPGTTITGLTASTAYEFYIQANCGTENSLWVGPISAMTNGTCQMYTLELYDDAEDGWDGASLEVYKNGTLFQTYTVSDDFASFQIPTNENDIISTVFVSGDYDDECSYTLFDENGDPVFESNVSFNGPGNIGNPSVPNGIQACATCAIPTDFEIVSSTMDEIELMWTEGNTETAWNIEYGAPGFTLGSGTTVNDTDGTPGTTITGLTASTAYEFYIQANCGIENSMWVGPISTYTSGTCQTYTLELYDEYGDGWNDASLQVYKNGTLFQTYTSDDDFASFQIPTNENDIISTIFISGDFDYECSYLLVDANNTIIYQGNMSDNGPGNFGNPLIPNGVQACPTCETPENLGVSNVDETIATLTWDAQTATEWNIQWGEQGFTFGTGTTANVNVDTLALTNLDGNTNYSFYVQTNCGTENSMWVGPFNFKTYCTPINGVDFCEDFEATSTTESCWNVIDQNQDGISWDTDYDFNANNGTECAVLYTDDNDGTDNDWLITPRLNLSGNEALQFYYRVQSSNEPNTFEVLLSTTGNQPADFQHVLMAANSYNNTTYKDTVITLDAFTGNVFIAFHVPNSTDDGWRLFIDDVCIEQCNPITPGIDGDSTFCAASGPLDLTTVATVDPNGTWNYNDNSLISGNMIDMSTLSAGTYEVKYIISTLCATDTAVATIELYEASNAGQDGNITACKNQPINLFDGIVGTYDVGGNWFNPSNAQLPNSNATTANFPGQYNYLYVTGNDVCPDDTSKIVVTVQSSCDWLSIDESALDQVSIYPNPSTGIVHIDITETVPMNLVVTDINGRTVEAGIKMITSETNSVDLSGVEKGVYFFKLTTESAEKTFRIVIQ